MGAWQAWGGVLWSGEHDVSSFSIDEAVCRADCAALSTLECKEKKPLHVSNEQPAGHANRR